MAQLQGGFRPVAVNDFGESAVPGQMAVRVHSDLAGKDPPVRPDEGEGHDDETGAPSRIGGEIDQVLVADVSPFRAEILNRGSDGETVFQLQRSDVDRVVYGCHSNPPFGQAHADVRVGWGS